jgi:cytochrome P450
VRLHNPLLSICKGTIGHSAHLTVNNSTYLIPAYTRVILNLNALHTQPKYWGNKNPDEWKPQRWIKNLASTSGIDTEYIWTPPKGSYLPWSDGMRTCPGKKFAQVEHVAIMANVFRRCRVFPKKNNNETMENAKLRALNNTEDSGMVLLFQLLHAENVPLVWEIR